MRYAILADIHGNLEALEAVMQRVQALQAQRLVFLGDVVGYGADPDRCMEILMHQMYSGVRGNHDKVVCGAVEAEAFPYSAGDVMEADLWSRRHLSARNLARLRELPAGPRAVDGRFVICHGAPQDEDAYIESEWGARSAMEFVEREFPGITLCFAGHTHVPLALQVGRPGCGSHGEPGKSVVLGEGQWLINPGSVGQPRDGDPRASFGLFDSERRVYTQYRVAYDVEEAQRKILLRGLPARFAHRLSLGG